MTAQHDPAEPGTARRIPVIAITGYLGAGKTTVLNHLLRAPGARLGVVVNDFGSINVDATLVSGQIDEAAAISGGCLCCLPDTGGLDDALERLSHPRLRLDAILIEASGVAEPGALARVIRFSGAERVRPGGVVEVIDAYEHFRTVDTHPEPPARYAAASLVVLGKTDLLAEHERADTLARIRERVRLRNPSVHLVEAQSGRIDPSLVFDTASAEDPVDELPLARLLREEAGGHDHPHAEAVSVALTGPVPPGALVDLLEDPPSGAYRVKGRVRVRGAKGERGYLVNVVGSSVHVEPLTEAPENGELVAIGMHLAVSEARARLRAIADAPDDRPDPVGLRRIRRHRRLSE
ncbi:CobW family GTP-binding protein [Microbacterium sp. 13-71-7]|jgi:G3E family GTPase|uniref:CobW family GTP-binding protein n=1 Tax=Microbacterium sp. 13-71-7 TaxID=1970399 RepID=UPI000BDCA57A|nr:CobW family GTP-binding protein [Microbacterium sp. 13-71-7]OZB83588.1 MAG: cobalamin biosynthesis protein CobW [Microbacterium sp. 13-71-7]